MACETADRTRMDFADGSSERLVDQLGSLEANSEGEVDEEGGTEGRSDGDEETLGRLLGGKLGIQLDVGWLDGTAEMEGFVVGNKDGRKETLGEPGTTNEGTAVQRSLEPCLAGLMTDPRRTDVQRVAVQRARCLTWPTRDGRRVGRGAARWRAGRRGDRDGRREEVLRRRLCRQPWSPPWTGPTLAARPGRGAARTAGTRPLRRRLPAMAALPFRHHLGGRSWGIGVGDRGGGRGGRCRGCSRPQRPRSLWQPARNWTARRSAAAAAASCDGGPGAGRGSGRDRARRGQSQRRPRSCGRVYCLFGSRNILFLYFLFLCLKWCVSN